MKSLVLRSSTQFLFPLMLLFSVFLLLRGHNAPGGGFSGGLVAASAFVLYAIAFDVASARRALRVDSRLYMGAGLLLGLGSGVVGFSQGRPFLKGIWWFTLEFGPDVKLSVGTPLLFEAGIYLTVVGAVLTIFFALMEE